MPEQPTAQQPSTPPTSTVQPSRVPAPFLQENTSPSTVNPSPSPPQRRKRTKRNHTPRLAHRVKQPPNTSKGSYGFRPVRPRLQLWRASRGRPLSRSTVLAQLLTATDTEVDYDTHVRAFQSNHIYHPLTGRKETYETLRAQNPSRWETSFVNEIGRLAQGVGTRMLSGNNNLFFIHRHQVPRGKKVTYANPVCDY